MILLGSDHGGYQLKAAIGEFLAQRGISFEDCGTDDGNSVDYPDFGIRVARRISEGAAEKGILICGTGIGMSIVANKFPGVRAALATDNFMAQMAKEHNNANIICLGARTNTLDEIIEFVTIYLETKFSHGERHMKRLDMIQRYEEEN